MRSKVPNFDQDSDCLSRNTYTVDTANEVTRDVIGCINELLVYALSSKIASDSVI